MFEPNDRLARYIAPEYRQDNRRAKVTAFFDEPSEKLDGLSVNSVAIHTLNQIAAIYEKKFSVQRPISISAPTISDYNVAAATAGVAIQRDLDSGRWTSQVDGVNLNAYELNAKNGNESHCLVRYTSTLQRFEMLKFAHRIAYKPTFGLY